MPLNRASKSCLAILLLSILPLNLLSTGASAAQETQQSKRIFTGTIRTNRPPIFAAQPAAPVHLSFSIIPAGTPVEVVIHDQISGATIVPDQVQADGPSLQVILDLWEPVIYTPNAYAFLGASRFNGKIYQLVERVLRHTTACLLAVGESERTRSINDVGFPESKVAVVNNAVSLPAERDTDEDLTEPMVLMVGRLCYQKNPEMFVRAAGRVHRRHPECRFELIGGGYQEHHGRTVRGLIDELDLQDRFEIHDWMTPQGVADRITQATIMVVPSRYDGLPFIPLEAMALGKPVVGTRVDGVQDVIVDGETGFLVDLDDDEAMAGKILRLLDDPELRERMGQAGRKRVEEHFNIAKNIRKIEAVYDDVYEHWNERSPSV